MPSAPPTSPAPGTPSSSLPLLQQTPHNKPHYSPTLVHTLSLELWDCDHLRTHACARLYTSRTATSCAWKRRPPSAPGSLRTHGEEHKKRCDGGGGAAWKATQEG